MNEVHELLAYPRLKIVQNKEIASFSMDSILLANFVKTNKDSKNIIDIGCGNGAILLYLSLKTKASIIGIEIQDKVYMMAKESVKLNNLEEQIKIFNLDANFLGENPEFINKFDIAVSNPPYFKYRESSNINKNIYLTTARHEISLNLDSLIINAKKVLREQGCFYLIHRSERLVEVIAKLNEHRFKVSRLRFIHSKPQDKSELFMLEAIKYGKKDLVIDDPLFIYNKNGQISLELRKIFNYKNQMN